MLENNKFMKMPPGGGCDELNILLGIKLEVLSANIESSPALDTSFIKTASSPALDTSFIKTAYQ